MGNAEEIPKEKPQSPLQIHLDKEFFFQEEAVTGKVSLNLGFAMIINDIQLILHVDEFWRYVETKDKTYTGRFSSNLLTTMMNIKQILKVISPEITLPPGQYNFPFSFVIPRQIQPSFEYRKGYGSYIRYSLNAKVISNYIKYTNETKLTIQSRPLILNQPLKYSSCVNIHSWSFFDQGSVILTASYPTNNYKMLDTVSLAITIDNTRGKMSTDSVVIELKRKYIYRHKNLKKAYDFDHQLHKDTYACIIKPKNKRTLEIKFPLVEPENKHLYGSISNNNVRANLMPTVHGFIVTCQYFLRIKVYFEKFVTNYYLPKIDMPIVITHQLIDEFNLEKKEDNDLQQALMLSEIEANKHINKPMYNNNIIDANFQDEDSVAPVAAGAFYSQKNLHQSEPIYNKDNINQYCIMQSQPMGINHSYNYTNMNNNLNTHQTYNYQNINKEEGTLSENNYPKMDLNQNSSEFNFNNNNYNK